MCTDTVSDVTHLVGSFCCHNLFKQVLTRVRYRRFNTVMAKLNETGGRYVNIPSVIFQDRSVAALEAVVVYLKDTHGLTYAQIADLLNRDDRTIWTTYQRATKKREAAP